MTTLASSPAWPNMRPATLQPAGCGSSPLRVGMVTHFMPPHIGGVEVMAVALPFKAGVFRFILCSEVIEHLENDDAAVQELARVLSKDGRAVITVPYTGMGFRASSNFVESRPSMTSPVLSTMSGPATTRTPSEDFLPVMGSKSYTTLTISASSHGSRPICKTLATCSTSE